MWFPFKVLYGATTRVDDAREKRSVGKKKKESSVLFVLSYSPTTKHAQHETSTEDRFLACTNFAMGQCVEY
jgi:hypothetical protein